MDLKVGVKLALRNKDGKYLLLRRNLNTYNDIKGQESWDFLGGKINPGKTLSENLQREIDEEIGANLEGSLHLLHAQDIILPDKHIVRLTYFSQLEDSLEINLDTKENTEYKWFSVNELKELEVVDKYVQEVANLNLLPE